MYEVINANNIQIIDKYADSFTSNVSFVDIYFHFDVSIRKYKNMIDI